LDEICCPTHTTEQAKVARHSLQFGNHKVDSIAPDPQIAAMLGNAIPRFHVFAAVCVTPQDSRTV
jgi:hypothetical protein